jgi:hypothetical protein
MRLYYGPPSDLTSFEDLLQEMPDGEFSKLTRSTVPLLAWWSDPKRVHAFSDCLGLGKIERASFEYPVSPDCPMCGGRGKSSFTDVMIHSKVGVVAVEAKYNEKLYPTVGDWLKTGKRDNKAKVLRHWINCCINRSVDLKACERLVYQMVHRTASARQAARDAPAHVVHLLFNSKHCGSYVTATKAIAEVLDPDHLMRFAVVTVEAAEGRKYSTVKDALAAHGSDVLREALVEKWELFTFAPPRLAYSGH